MKLGIRRSRSMLFPLVVALALTGLSGCESGRARDAGAEDASTAIAVEEISIPDRLIVLDPNAVAFQVPWRANFICDRWLDLGQLFNRTVAGKSLSLVMMDGDRAWFVDNVRRGDQIQAHFAPGATYVVMETPIGPAGDAYELMRQAAALELPDDICKRILCLPPGFDQPQPATVLLDQYPSLRPYESQLGLAGRKIGWYPGSVCDRCLGGVIPSGGSGPPDECDPIAPPQEPPCRDDGWTLVFSADFNAMTPSQPPLSAPPGPPAADAIVLSGPSAFRVVQDVSLGSNALEIIRTGDSRESSLTANLDGGKVQWGRVCIDFRIRKSESSRGPLLVNLLSSRDEILATLTVDPYYRMAGANGSVPIGLQAGGGSGDRVHLELFLDAGYVSLHINGFKLTTQPMNSVYCRDFESLNVLSPGSITESQALDYVIDDLKIQSLPNAVS